MQRREELALLDTSIEMRRFFDNKLDLQKGECSMAII